jgi:hypothetical protein
MSTSSASALPDPNEILHAILHGNITKGFPDPPSRVIKLFISSTKAGMDSIHFPNFLGLSLIQI